MTERPKLRLVPPVPAQSRFTERATFAEFVSDLAEWSKNNSSQRELPTVKLDNPTKIAVFKECRAMLDRLGAIAYDECVQFDEASIAAVMDIPAVEPATRVFSTYSRTELYAKRNAALRGIRRVMSWADDETVAALLEVEKVLL